MRPRLPDPEPGTAVLAVAACTDSGGVLVVPILVSVSLLDEDSAEVGRALLEAIRSAVRRGERARSVKVAR